MNYSRKKTGKILSGSAVSTLSALVVLGTAMWFCSGFETVTVTSPVQAAEPAASGPPEKVAVTIDEPEDDGFLNPTQGVLTSSFGERWGRKHNGIDIGADYNTDIIAADSGTVTYAAEMNGYGNYVVIDHGNGFETAYAHCATLLVSEGEMVEKGQLIALVGSTGTSTGPQLHFEVKMNGEFCNPLDYVIY